MFLFHAAVSELDLLPSGCHYHNCQERKKVMGFSALADSLTLIVDITDNLLLFQSRNASHEKFEVKFSRKIWGSLRLYNLYEQLILSHMVCPMGFCSELSQFCDRKQLNDQIPDYLTLNNFRFPKRSQEITKQIEELSDLYERVSRVQNVIFGYICTKTLSRFKIDEKLFKVLIDFFGITYCQIVLEYMVLGNKLGTQVSLIETYVKDLSVFYDLLSGKLYSMKFRNAAPYQISDIVGTMGEKGNFFVLTFPNEDAIKTSLLITENPSTAHAIGILRLLFLKGLDGLFAEGQEHIVGLMRRNSRYLEQLETLIKKEEPLILAVKKHLKKETSVRLVIEQQTKKEASEMLDMMLFLLFRYFSQHNGSASKAAQQIKNLLQELLSMEQTEQQEKLSEEEKLAKEIEAEELTQELEDVSADPSSFFLHFIADMIGFLHYINDKDPNIMVVQYVSVCLQRYSLFFDPVMESMFIHDRETYGRFLIEQSYQTRWDNLWEAFLPKKHALAVQALIRKEQQERVFTERQEKAIRDIGQKRLGIRWEEIASRYTIETGALRRLARDAYWCAYLALAKTEKWQRQHLTERERYVRLRTLESSGLWWEQKKQRYVHEKASLDWLANANRFWSGFANLMNEGYQQAAHIRYDFERTIQDKGSVLAAMHYLYQSPSEGLWADEMDELDPI